MVLMDAHVRPPPTLAHRRVLKPLARTSMNWFGLHPRRSAHELPDCMAARDNRINHGKNRELTKAKIIHLTTKWFYGIVSSGKSVDFPHPENPPIAPPSRDCPPRRSDVAIEEIAMS